MIHSNLKLRLFMVLDWLFIVQFVTPNYVFILRGILVRIWIFSGFCISLDECIFISI